jgi:hypothetical protein
VKVAPESCAERRRPAPPTLPRWLTEPSPLASAAVIWFLRFTSGMLAVRESTDTSFRSGLGRNWVERQSTTTVPSPLLLSGSYRTPAVNLIKSVLEGMGVEPDLDQESWPAYRSC